MKQKPALERAARALCTLAGNPENTKFEGKPMWMSYLPEARAALSAIKEPSSAMLSAVYAQAAIDNAQFDIGPDKVWEIMIDAALEEG